MSTPRRRDRTRPAEVLGLAALLALFVGVGVLVVTRDWVLAIEFFGVGFIVSVVVLAMLLLAITPRSPVDGSNPDGSNPDGSDPNDGDLPGPTGH